MSKHRDIPPVPTAPPGTAVHTGLHTGPIRLVPISTDQVTLARSQYADGTVMFTVGKPGLTYAHTASPEEALIAVMNVLGITL